MSHTHKWFKSVDTDRIHWVPASEAESDRESKNYHLCDLMHECEYGSYDFEKEKHDDVGGNADDDDNGLSPVEMLIATDSSPCSVQTVRTARLGYRMGFYWNHRFRCDRIAFQLLSALVYMYLLHRSKCECANERVCGNLVAHFTKLFFTIVIVIVIISLTLSRCFWAVDDACWWPLVLLLLLLLWLWLLFSQPIIIWLCSFKVYLLISRVSINKGKSDNNNSNCDYIATAMTAKFARTHTPRKRDTRSTYSFIYKNIIVYWRCQLIRFRVLAVAHVCVAIQCGGIVVVCRCSQLLLLVSAYSISFHSIQVSKHEVQHQ